METFRTIAILGLLIVVLTACGSNPPYRLGPIGGPGANSFDEYSEGSIPANAELTSVHAPIVPPGQEVCGHPGTRPVHYIQSGYSPPSGSKGPKHGGGFVCTALHIFTPPHRGRVLLKNGFVSLDEDGHANLTSKLRGAEFGTQRN